MIQVSNVSKTYKIVKKKRGLRGAIRSLFKPTFEEKIAVNNISFRIEPGEMVGYIGSNGAGKSTTIKMMSGVLTPSFGEILVNGVVPYNDRIKNAYNIGVLFGQRTQLFWDIPVIESFDLIKDIYEISDIDFCERVDYFTKVLDLTPLLDLPIRQMSLGQKMRCEIAAAFLHSPQVVYLDEPTIGLDVDIKSKIRTFIRDMNKKMGTTVVLTTHDMKDIEEICNRIIILDKGEIIYDGNKEEIVERFGKNRIVNFYVNNADNFYISNIFQIEENQISKKPGLVRIEINENKSNITSVISEVLLHNSINNITISEPNIESIVQEIYTRGVF